MKSVRKWIRDLFGFSANEINGFLVLAPLMLLLVVSEPVYRLWISHQNRDFTADLKALDALVAEWHGDHPKHASRVVLTAFDPNTATESELQTVGFPEDLARRVAAYRKKGG